MTLVARRRLLLTLTAVAGATLVCLLPPDVPWSARPTRASGWLLGAAVLFLAAYNLRKKFPTPPLGAARTWLQAHIYVGWLSLLLFALHLGGRVPLGLFGRVLASGFLLTAVSGIVGLLLSRALPRHLTARGDEVIFERIPAHLAALRSEAEHLVLTAVEQTDATTLADFYAARLADFFAGPRNRRRHLLRPEPGPSRLIGELSALDRFFDEGERALARDLARLIEAKHHLDHHWAVQGALKLWLFVHVPLTYALLLLLAAHLLLVHAFASGAP